MHLFSRRAGLLASVIVALTVGRAEAGYIDGAATGLANPTVTQNFTNPSLAPDTEVTNQFAGVTFSPYLYFSPQSGFGITPNSLGNYNEQNLPAFVDPVTLTFASSIDGAAFQMAADTTPYTFTALLNGVVVDTGTSTVGSTAAFYGFSDEFFNQLTISEAGAGDGPYYLIGNLELGPSMAPAGAPAPLAGAGLLSFLGASGIALRRRVRQLIGALLSQQTAAA